MTVTMPDALIVVDARGCIQSFGPEAERLFGYHDVEVLDRNFNSLLPARDRGADDDDFAHGRETGQSAFAVKQVVIAQREDGSMFPMHLTVHELPPPSGQGLFGAQVRDLTASVDHARRLEELRVELVRTACQSELDHLASRLAFEVDQPLAEFGDDVGFDMETLRVDLQADALRTIAPLMEVSERLSEIMRRLRCVLKSGTGEKRVEDLADTIEVASGMALADVHRSLTLNIRVAADAAEAVIDRNSIQQVLRQLIRRAIRSMAAAARQEITIAATRSGDMIEISIAETAPTPHAQVPLEAYVPLAQIHPRFFRPISLASEAGLSFCRDIIEANGGNIRSGDRPDPGSRGGIGGVAFRFTLPHRTAGND
jgi:two-component system, LuxR family, sensor kinase FixL